ncbi:hypothetical protein [Paenibacillus sp. MY03]|uniref:MGH1-like glycoside hydrolase domain-containing protein n=1 Tax=Paenibacillus sp. MY03 TaxID=302980 RepID=UPI00211B13D5|nr:hypothetical protein [Paenibacillus sp. MY03]
MTTNIDETELASFRAAFADLDAAERVGKLNTSEDKATLGYFVDTGVKFSASSPLLENAYYEAVRRLLDCVKPNGEGRPILQEGGVYYGCWLESTGTINAELCARFMPAVTEATYRQFAELQREDGLLPYKITEAGAVFKQIQLVTPPARSAWNYYALHKGRVADDYLPLMYGALSRYDDWLARHRDTRGSGCVEAFCAFDTGHDLSPRFWHVPDTPHLDDPALPYPDSPLVPFLAPDLTASVYCSRRYLALMARELGLPHEPWQEKAEASFASLMKHCFEEEDHFFYDVDKQGRHVKVQSDVLLRVMASEVGDRDFFDRMLRLYLLNTSKFFAKYPFTSLAMDDPRFDPFASYNTWAGATNFLSLIRAPHAFEHHGRYVELTWVLQPIVSALARMTRFGQVLSPWTGKEGFAESYSPSLLCMLDYVERLSGILPTTSGELWFTGLLPYPFDHGEKLAERTAYSREVDDKSFELINGEEECRVYIDGKLAFRFPAGIRLITDRAGQLTGLIGMSARRIEGAIQIGGAGEGVPFGADGNEELAFEAGAFRSVSAPGIVYPTYR